MSDDTNEERVPGLLQRISRRDQGALQELHLLFARRIYSFAIHRLGDAHDAETVAADTLFEVWRRPEAFHGESKFSTWLLGIARNKMLTTLRRRRNHVDLEDAPEPVDPDPGPDMVLESAQRKRLIDGCMETLDKLRRECLHLVFVEGMSLADVAGMQEVPVGTVKTRLFHARQKLKDCVKVRSRAAYA